MIIFISENDVLVPQLRNSQNKHTLNVYEMGLKDCSHPYKGTSMQITLVIQGMSNMKQMTISTSRHASCEFYEASFSWVVFHP